MNFNLTILEKVTETAKVKAAGNAAWVRAIEKAAEQLITNPYICERDGGLLILSYSGETYHANGACQCRAFANGMPCWHRAAAQLVKRYNEAAAAQKAAPAPVVETATDERAVLISAIEVAWFRARQFEAIGYSLHRVFGVTKLEDVSTDDLRRVLDALRGAPAPAPIAPRPRSSFVIVYRAAANACARGGRLPADSASVWRVRPVSSSAAFLAHTT